MKVYHTSYTEIRHPNVRYSRNYLDFGKGFYLTTLKRQAEKYAARIAIRHLQAVLNTYELDTDYGNCLYKRFNTYDEDWLDFVAACRNGVSDYCFDVIEGGVANDKVFDTIDLYFSGRMSKQDALRRLIYEKPNWQICITKQEIIDTKLSFIHSELLTL